MFGSWRQDNWRVLPQAGVISPSVASGTGSDASLVAQGNLSGSAQIAVRTNDSNFSFQQFSGLETNAAITFDGSVSVASSRYNVGANFALGHGTDVGPLFGEDSDSANGGAISFYLRGAENGTDYYAPFPAAINAGDRLRFTLIYDFTANGGDGAGSLFYQDLTTGGSLTAVVGLQHIDLDLTRMSASSQPADWDEMWARTDNGSLDGAASAIDNLVPNAIPEPASVGLFGVSAAVFLLRRRV
jgi:hypothetical protein